MSIFKDNTQRYGLVSQILHWGLAGLTIAAFLLGQIFEDAPRADKGEAMYWHASVGLLVVGFFVVRAAWRFQQTNPEELSRNVALVWAHKIVIWALYAIPFALVITGMIAVVSGGFSVPFFGVEFLSGWAIPDRDMHELMGDIHGVLGKGLMFVFVAHTLAAVWHQFIKRDGTLARMLPARLTST